MHQAADGGLARVRLPGGVLSNDQLQVLAAAAADLGDGNLELTSRANLQLRGLQPDAPRELSDRLYAAGLLPSVTHERVRNILASPLSGLDQHGQYDVLPAVAELDRLLCARPALAELSGRFLFALDDGRGDLDGLGADVAVRALPNGQATVVLGGSDTGLCIDRTAVARVMVSAAEAFLAERFAQQSEAWRLTELVDGPPRVLARLRDSGTIAAGGSPHELMDDGTSGPAGPLTGAVVASIALGVWQAEQVAAVLAVADHGVRVTPWRSVVIVGVAAEDVPDVRAALGTAGLVVDPESPWVGVTACAGRPGCAKSRADVRGDARAVLPGRAGARLPVHWSGCERRCGRPAGAFVDVVAVEDGYLVDGSLTSRNEVGAAITGLRT